ncbi:heparinase [Alphaproteobacteria bacterium GH1-50]|uniref:Heparinase n=1 Tax=Kangsaoukella pontilimi TaxID=2691042 RepID=A0A7C9MKL2_9RHOB|nr:heparinase II/III family protein [Kangsaoukella pontilimi]MXQ08575.1 heparinase [Kangsaoukella pontilimi]
MNRFHARAATLSRPATAFTSTPEPRTIGSFARGRQLTGGNFLFAGFLVEAPETMIWDLPMPDDGFEAELHGFTWLDDLAAVGDMHASARAREWTHEWVARYGRGKGPGWTPDLTGRRLIRWINHAILLLNGQERDASEAYFRSLATQTIFLSRRWKAASPGLPRFEALTGLIYAGLALTGMDGHVEHAMRGLARECANEIDADGGLSTRNPEELLEVFTLLNWAAAALQDAGRSPGAAHLASIAAIAPVLRALRHSDGGLARFHGGGRGLEGRLDRSLATSGVRAGAQTGLAMGFARVSHGRTSVIIDAARPPRPDASVNAHASTLAIEVTSGRRPLIVNCGSGATFGKSWRRAGRATPSHSTLGLEGLSSSRLGQAGRVSGRAAEYLVDAPREVLCQRDEVDGGTRLSLSHDGYVGSHGLLHQRTLHLGYDGRSLRGEDILVAADTAAKKRFDLAFDKSKLKGIGFAVRFHLHPDVDATLDMNGTAVSMALKSGEIWIFRFRGDASMALDSSVYLEKSRLSPRATKQVVLTGRAMEYSTRVSWSLAKAQETPSAVRDYAMDGLLTVN